MLDNIEYQDFGRVVMACGYSCHDFEISNAYLISRDGRANQIVSQVIIRYIPKNTTRTYIAGCKSYWLLELEEDLISSSFSEMVRR